MRRPEPVELEFAIVALIVFAPMVYFAVRGLVALLS